MRLHPLATLVLASSLSFAGIIGVHALLTHERKDDPVGRVMDTFVPGLKTGRRVADLPSMTSAITELRYVPNVGYIGVPDKFKWLLPDHSKLGFDEVRLLLDARTRSEAQADPAKSRIDAVQLVTADSTAPRKLASALATWFGSAPRVGCSPTANDQRLRDVQLWLTPPAGPDGVALIVDLPLDPEPQPLRPRLTSLLAFRGNFQGSNTLRATFTDSTCAQVASGR